MMAKLILSMDGLVLKEIPLSKERTTIGRRSHNDIQIDNLAISGEHAAVVSILDDSFLEDLNSTNGTLVNGQPIKKHFLKNNDVIELGKYKLKYIVEQAAPGETERFERPPPRPAAGRPAPAATSAVPPAAQGAAAIRLLNGGNAGRQLDLTKAQTTLGKPGVQVAVIARHALGYVVTHVEGAQFPVVNGRPVGAQPHPLRDHDVIEIAGVRMEFFLKA